MKKFLACVFFIKIITVSPSACAESTERTEQLGVINSQIKDNQIIEVRRSLLNPVIYQDMLPNKLSKTFRIKNSTARQGPDGSVYVSIEQTLPGTSDKSRITAQTILLVDGKRVPLMHSDQGTDILLSMPENITPQNIVSLTTDEPVTVQIPSSWRGQLNMTMEVSGEP
ncbi:Uncharacterised protein [Citrobacter freundii]|nr:Uncharacterised protein [Citrobacter freundii]SUY95191.1 Uncharacterised protein [Citrobacter freundii]